MNVRGLMLRLNAALRNSERPERCSLIVEHENGDFMYDYDGCTYAVFRRDGRYYETYLSDQTHGGSRELFERLSEMDGFGIQQDEGGLENMSADDLAEFYVAECAFMDIAPEWGGDQ